MRNIYSCIDIGSDCIKIVVCEFYHGRYNLLATSSCKSKGIKKGLIVDVASAKRCIKKCFDDINEMLGFNIDKVIAIVPSYFALFKIVNGQIKIENKVKGIDIVNVLQNSMKSDKDYEKEMITTIPIDFSVDNKVTKKPLGMVGNKLYTRAIMVTTPRKNVYSVVEVLNSLKIDVVDVGLGCIGNINTFKNEQIENDISCIVDIGAEKTEVSMYNKGIIVKHSVVNMGSKNVDSDISYMYKISMDDAKKLKEEFAIANFKNSSCTEIREVLNTEGKNVRINQYELSQIVTSRLNEIFDLVKQELNNLTIKRPNSIIVTGGITNMLNFSNICREKLGKCAIIGSINLIGLRNNKFSAAIGNIIYFVNKLKLSEENYSMVNKEDCESLSEPKKNNMMLGKLTGYFFGE